MVDRKTGLKPKKATSNKKQVTSAEKKTKKVAETVAETAPADSSPEPKIEIEEKTTKAGKHSTKAQREAEEKQAKEERKATAKTEEGKPKIPVKPPRSRAERAGKKYREAAKLIDRSRLYPATEALELAIKISPAKFDATIELHANLAVDPAQADQNIRGTVVLPAGTGKTLRVAVLAEGEDAKKAESAGADRTGGDALLADLDKETVDFDILITTPTMMPRLAKYARLLGPKGLMPNPKSGTVTADIVKAVTEAKAGRLEYRVDSAGIIHLPIGKASFGTEKLSSNLDVVLDSVRAAKPASVKGIFIKSAYLASTMGPSIKLEV